MARPDTSQDAPRGSGRPGVPRSPGLDVADPQGRLAPPRLEWLRLRATEGLGVLGAAGEVRVRIVGDAEMASAHEEFAGVPGTTDVLTFDLTDPELPLTDPPMLDTDILVCADEATRQATSRGHEP